MSINLRMACRSLMVELGLFFLVCNIIAGTPNNAKLIYWRGENSTPSEVMSCGFNYVFIYSDASIYSSLIASYLAEDINVIGKIDYYKNIVNENVTYAIDDPSSSTALSNFYNFFTSYSGLAGAAWDAEIHPEEYISEPGALENFKYYSKRTGDYCQDQIEFNDPVIDQNPSSPYTMQNTISRWEDDGVVVSPTFKYCDSAGNSPGGWYASSSSVFSGGVSYHNKVANDRVEITFSGTEAGIICRKGPSEGIINIKIDDYDYGSIDLYSSAVYYQSLFPVARNLSDETHTLTITNTGTKNSSSSDCYIRFDAVELSLPAVNRKEQTDSSFAYSGTWNTANCGAHSGGSATYTSEANASAEITFTGTKAVLVCRKGPDGGIANIMIDGVPQSDIDLYCASNTYQSVTVVKDDLSTGSHTLTITNSGTKNSSSTGYDVYVDAFDTENYAETVVIDNNSPFQPLGHDADCVRVAQTFTYYHDKMSAVAFKMKKTTSGTANAVDIYIQAVDSNGVPTGSKLEGKYDRHASYDANNNYYVLYKAYLPIENLVSGQTYAAVLSFSGTPSTSSYYQLASCGSDSYTGGKAFKGTATSWTEISNDDLKFFVYYPQDTSSPKLRDDWADFKCWQNAQCAEIYRDELKLSASITETAGLATNTAPSSYTTYVGYDAASDKRAQTFKPTASYLSRIEFKVKKQGTGRPINGVEVSIQNTVYDSTQGCYIPNGEVLASSTLPEIGVGPSYELVSIPLECFLDTDKTYAIVIDYDNGEAGGGYHSDNYYRFTAYSSSVYSEGTFLRGSKDGSWTNLPNYEFSFSSYYLNFSSASEIVGENNIGTTYSVNYILGYDSTYDKRVQTFQPRHKYLSKIEIYMRRVSDNLPDSINASIQKAAYDDSLKTYVPDGNILTTCTIDPASISKSFELITLNLDCMLNPRHKYALVLDCATNSYSTTDFYQIRGNTNGNYYSLGNVLRGNTNGDTWYNYPAFNDDLAFKVYYKKFPDIFVYSGYQNILYSGDTVINEYSTNWKYLGDHADFAVCGFNRPLADDCATLNFKPELIGGTMASTPNGVMKVFLQNMIDTHGTGAMLFDTVGLSGSYAVALTNAIDILADFEDLFINGENNYYTGGVIATNDAVLNNDYYLATLDRGDERLVFVFNISASKSNIVVTNSSLPAGSLRYLEYDMSTGSWSKASAILQEPDSITINIDNIAADEIKIFYISTNAKVDDKLQEISQ